MNKNRVERTSANDLTGRFRRTPQNWSVPSATLQESSFKNSPLRLH